jgi:hypothetical protein
VATATARHRQAVAFCFPPHLPGTPPTTEENSMSSQSLSPYPPDFLAVLPDLRAHAVRSVRAAKQEHAEILERSESIARAVGDTAWLETIVQDRRRLDEALDPLIPWIETADFENYAVCRWLDRGNRQLEEMLEGMPRLVVGIRQLKEEKARLETALRDKHREAKVIARETALEFTKGQGGDDPSTWVPASKLCPDKGVPLKGARAFCEKHKIRWRKPSPQRLEIHAGDWTRHWADTLAGEFDGLDQGGKSSIFGKAEIVVEGAAERLKQLRAKKGAGK